MKDYYAGRAPYYDDVYNKPERQADIVFLRQHLPARLAGRRVLEVACGTGYWSQHIAPVCTAYTATDGVAEPLSFARERPGLQAANCVLADAYALPAALGQFEAAFAGLWFSHVPIERHIEFLKGLHARLLPGARVVLIDNNEVQCRDFPIVERDAQGNTYQERPLRDGTTHRVLKNFPSEEALRRLATHFSATTCEFRMLENFWLFEYDLP